MNAPQWIAYQVGWETAQLYPRSDHGKTHNNGYFTSNFQRHHLDQINKRWGSRVIGASYWFDRGWKAYRQKEINEEKKQAILEQEEG